MHPTEATIDDLQLAFKQNQLTSRQLVEFYIGEIREINSVLKGVIEVNLDAPYEAGKADHERNAKAPRSLSGLHGIPILIKDTIGTKEKLIPRLARLHCLVQLCLGMLVWQPN